MAPPPRTSRPKSLPNCKTWKYCLDRMTTCGCHKILAVPTAVHVVEMAFPFEVLVTSEFLAPLSLIQIWHSSMRTATLLTHPSDHLPTTHPLLLWLVELYLTTWCLSCLNLVVVKLLDSLLRRLYLSCFSFLSLQLCACHLHWDGSPREVVFTVALVRCPASPIGWRLNYLRHST